MILDMLTTKIAIISAILGIMFGIYRAHNDVYTRCIWDYVLRAISLMALWTFIALVLSAIFIRPAHKENYNSSSKIEIDQSFWTD